MRTELQIGDRLISVTVGQTTYDVRQKIIGPMKVREITIGQMTGPMAYYLTAQVTFEGSEPDIVIPLHMAEQWSI